jgi:DNA repair protein RAD16
MQQQEQSDYKGGILADEMGMGKTIQMISLIVSRLDIRPNLIITPTVALMQWYAELKSKTTNGLLNIVLFHGAKRETDKKELESADIVLTTYAILEQSYRKEHYGTKRKGQLVKSKSLLHSIHWGRMILDEAHAIKDRYCSTAKASFAINCDYKWSLSGTPLQNRVGELFSLIRLMNLYPHSYYFCTRCPCKMQQWSFKDHLHCDHCGHTGHQHFCYWNREILKPIQKYGNQGDGLLAFKKLGSVLDRIMLRRTKIERNDELGLPPRIVECRRDVFNDAEEELYDSLYSDTNRTYNTYVTEGTVLNNYASIFSLLSRMRLAANHPDLVTTKLQPKENKSVCVVCHEEAEDPILSKCKHIFCREDASQYIQSIPVGESPRCPSCFRELTIDLTQPELKHVNSSTVQTSIVNQLDLENWRSSTKIEAIVEELTQLKSENATAKSLVFSQFVSFLDLLHWRLSRGGFNVVKLDGRMGPEQRATIIDKFMTDASVTVFLISLKAGGTALNLTEASHVFIADPWWNPAVESSCN